MKTGPSTRIIFHWILVIFITGVLAYYIEINKIVFLLLICFLVLTLVFNRTTYLNLKDNKLIISKNNFLIISTSKFSIDLSKIDEFSINNYRENNSENISSVVDFEGAILVDILTGIHFYKPTHKLIINSAQNKLIEIEINTQRKDVIRIKQELKKSSRVAY